MKLELRSLPILHPGPELWLLQSETFLSQHRLESDHFPCLNEAAFKLTLKELSVQV